MVEINRVRGSQLRHIYQAGRTLAEGEYRVLKDNPLFTVALATYWGEGDKASKYVCRLANTDPQMIRLFGRFLSEICLIPQEKIRYWLLLYPDLDEQECKKYWEIQAGIPTGHFTKSVTIVGKHKTKKLSYGVCTVFVSSRYLKEKMLVWLRLLADDFAPIEK